MRKPEYHQLPTNLNSTSISGSDPKESYNKKLREFKSLESEIEHTPSKFLELKSKWISLGNELSSLLHRIPGYTNYEACHGFGSNEYVRNLLNDFRKKYK